MSQSTSDQIAQDTSPNGDEAQNMAFLHPNKVVPTDSAANDLIVQCLLIAARRGRQVRLAREQATQLQQSEPGAIYETPSQPDET